MKKKNCFLFLIFVPLWARVEYHVHEGNLALPTSQLPSPLFSTGQKIVDKGDILFHEFTFQEGGKRKQFSSYGVEILYGLSDYADVLLRIPVAAPFKKYECTSQGVLDCMLFFEYAFYSKDTTYAIDQATAVFQINFPTGSDKKSPVTGFGSPSFLVGLTAAHLAIDWYVFASPFALLTTGHNETKFGNQFWYQAGFGKNIAYRSDKWLLTWIVEFDGYLFEKDRRCGKIDHESGGNIIYLGPVLWFATQKLILRGGIQFPVYQNLHGKENKKYVYNAAFYLVWKFN